MQHPVWMFIRLVWSEWASRVTGSLSAVLVLLGLGISLAGTFGARVPASSIIQLATWVLAAACGGQAAYAVWLKERQARETAEAKLRHSHGLSFDFRLAYDQTNQVNTLEIRMVMKNESQTPLSWNLRYIETKYPGIKTVRQETRGPFILHPAGSVTWFPNEGLSESQFESLARETKSIVRYEVTYGLAGDQPDRISKGENEVMIIKKSIGEVDYHNIIKSQVDEKI